MKKANKTIQRKFHLFNAEGKILGRFCTEICKFLRGKHKSDFTPNIDGGDCVVVTNSDGLRFTGNKPEGKVYHQFSGYPGGITSIKLKDQMKKDSTQVVKRAVYGMLSKNKLRNRMMARLYIYKDSQHSHKIDITH